MLMARFLISATVLAAACAAALGAQPAGALPVDATEPPTFAAKLPLEASLDRCVRSGKGGRFAKFKGEMPAIDGASRLQMRFDLFSRPDIGGEWAVVKDVPTFGNGNWTESKRGVPGLRVKKRVSLNQGWAYRVTVSYRWLADSGKVIRSASRSSKACTQPDPRPDLGVGARADSGDIVVIVRNLGRTSRPTVVRLSSGAAQIATTKLPAIGSGRERSLVFRAVACEPGSKVTVRVDPDRKITERSEANNGAELQCPASS